MEKAPAHSLSDLPNRSAFNEAINKALLQAKRYNKILAVLLIQLDNFQKLKTTQDAAKIEPMLEELSQRLHSCLRVGDFLAHLEPNVFGLLLTDVVHAKWLGSVAEKLLKASTLPYTLSIGISLFPDDGQTMEELQIKLAAALNEAQSQGGGHYRFAQSQRTLESQNFTQLQAELRQALKNKEFVLYYQPKLDLKTKTLSGVEALIRWKHPRLGLIDPFQFIPSAEESQVIVAIGDWALREACFAAKFWQSQGIHPLAVAVNLSSKQLYHPALIRSIEVILKETNLEPSLLELEITEMTVMDDTARVNPILQGLKKLGLSLALDDFGTGHTSIRYLSEFPIDTVKIDQSFIKLLPQDSKSAAITSAIITLAHQLDLRVVAEGVETSEQMKLLSELNCDQAQGYYIARPLLGSNIIAYSFWSERQGTD